MTDPVAALQALVRIPTVSYAETERIDTDAVFDFLSKHAYWAEGRSRELIERLITESQRVVGLYYEGRQVGFSRTVSDGASVTYKAWVCTNPLCGFNLRIDNGEVSIGRALGQSQK